MADVNKEWKLPEAFESRMRDMLGEEYEAFEKSFSSSRTYGLRVNRSKILPEQLKEQVPFDLTPIPWIDNGYFYTEETKPSWCPYYQAGLYYLQEPSAMTPASRLPIEPGDYVLDLCAAPGGKATALGDALNGEGLLFANDISASRAKALMRNVELFGLTNACVTSEPPEKLVGKFPEFFDKIMLDAPCSGEGMFRKEEALLRDWTPEKSRELSEIQRKLVLNAVDMLRPGGMLLYSTCTFAPIEDEGTISWLLTERPEMELLEIPGYEGFAKGNPKWGNGDPRISRCVRIFPHQMEGEGHFLALLQKNGEAAHTVISPRGNVNRDAKKWIQAFLDEIHLKSLGGKPFDWNRVEVRNDKVYYLPPVDLDLRGIKFLRNGIYLGDMKKNRFEPSEPFALALRKGEADAVSLPVTDERLTRYLKGEPITLAPEETDRSKGWILLAADGHPFAFGKLVGQTLKNKYPVGWRV
ncbi:MAG: RsmB/NOP family class I SAM-dependent RNA methyltransferase [Eubacteriales bacterium]|nr:RsmB/NOP family class I SAM-dependent RNA methyltransferase [Eubacteriales bacterium]